MKFNLFVLGHRDVSDLLFAAEINVAADLDIGTISFEKRDTQMVVAGTWARKCPRIGRGESSVVDSTRTHITTVGQWPSQRWPNRSPTIKQSLPRPTGGGTKVPINKEHGTPAFDIGGA